MERPHHPDADGGNPRAVFERLFGEGGSPKEQAARLERDRSVLDLAMADMARLQKRLGVRDRVMVDEYLDSVRDVEQRIQRAERQSKVSPMPIADPPVGVPDSFDDHAKLMFDLELLAFQSDVTRVVAFQVSRELNGRPYPWIGVPEGHHAVSHHQMDPVKIAQGAKINAYHVSLFARFLDRMKNTPDGDGSLLDHTLLLYGTGMATATTTPRSTCRRWSWAAAGHRGRASHPVPDAHAVHEPRPDPAPQGRRRARAGGRLHRAVDGSVGRESAAGASRQRSAEREIEGLSGGLRSPVTNHQGSPFDGPDSWPAGRRLRIRLRMFDSRMMALSESVDGPQVVGCGSDGREPPQRAALLDGADAWIPENRPWR